MRGEPFREPFKRLVIECTFYQLEVVSRYRDPQIQVGENDLYLFNLRPVICKHTFRDK